MAGADSFAGHLRSLRSEIDAALAALDLTGRPVALLDAAAYANAGDCAITVATIRSLERVGARIVHVADHRHYDRRAAASAIGGEGIVLLQGGGNLGDLHLRNQRFREQVLHDFPSHRIVQLPQSIWFDDPHASASFGALVRSHGGVELLVRDAASLRYAHEHLGVRARLVPDLAYSLGPWRPPEPEVDLLWVLRTDKESTTPVVPHDATDWPGDRTWARRAPVFGALLVVERATRTRPVAGRPTADRVGRRLLVPLASQRLRHGRRWLGRARTIVTDRLHVHVLATLMDLPHVVVDSRTHKLTEALATWPGWPPGSLAVASSSEPAALEEALARLRPRG